MTVRTPTVTATVLPRYETHDTGILRPNSRIYFTGPVRASSSISSTCGRSIRGIKKAGFLERIFGKATKLSFDQGSTHTWVNTNSLKKFIYQITPHYDYYQCCKATRPTNYRDAQVLTPSSSADIEKAHNVSFKAFKARAMSLRRGADSSLIPIHLSKETRLGEYLSEYVSGIHLFYEDSTDPERSNHLKEIDPGSKLDYSDVAVVRVASNKVYQDRENWAALHKYIHNFAFSKKRTDNLDAQEVTRRERLAAARAHVLRPQQRENQNGSTLRRVDSAVRGRIGEKTTDAAYATAAIAITGATFGFPVAATGAALLAAVKLTQMGYQTFTNPADKES